MGNKSPQPRAAARGVDESTGRELYTRFLDVSTAMLSTALRADSNINDLIDAALALVKDVAQSEVEILCVRVGEDACWRGQGLDNGDDAHLEIARPLSSG
jgi:hypothetical protein